MRTLLAIFLCSLVGPTLVGQTTLNLSHDLVSLGIANQNMVPNSPTLDAQPLFTAAIQYAQNNSVSTVIADPGAYYFLTSQNDFIYRCNAKTEPDLLRDFQPHPTLCTFVSRTVRIVVSAGMKSDI